MTKIGLKGQNDQNCRIDTNMLNDRDEKRGRYCQSSQNCQNRINDQKIQKRAQRAKRPKYQKIQK